MASVSGAGRGGSLGGGSSGAFEGTGRKKNFRRRARAPELTDPARFLAVAASLDPSQLEWLQQVAVKEWVAKSLEDETARAASVLLGRLCAEKFGDPWLADLTATVRPEHKDRDRRAFEALAQAASLNEAARSVEAMRAADTAMGHFVRVGNVPGALRAKFELLYAARWTRQMAEPPEEATRLMEASASRRYGWLQWQSWVEGDGSAAASGHRPIGLVRPAGLPAYPDLDLREHSLNNFAAAAFSGAEWQVWLQTPGMLQRYWSSAVSPTRGYQLFYNLHFAANALELRHASFIALREASEELSLTSNRELEATLRIWLASLAESLGDSAGAAAEQNRGDRLLGNLQETPTWITNKLNRQILAARLDRMMGNPDKSLRRLENVRDKMPSEESTELSLPMHRETGLALIDLHREAEAEQFLREAMRIGQRTNGRSSAGGRGSSATVSMREVQLGLIRALTVSRRVQLADWEAYRSGAIQGAGREPNPASSLKTETLLAIMPQSAGFQIWVADDRGIHESQIAVDMRQFSLTARRLIRLCANPESSPQLIERDVKQINDWLFSSVSKWLGADRTLLIETEGVAAGLPFALMSARQFGKPAPTAAIESLSHYRRRLTKVKPINERANALIIAAPELGGPILESFPPLEDAGQEGDEVAALFPRSRRLTGSSATWSQIRPAVAGASIVHFSGHGFANAGSGGLLIAPESARDGFATVDADAISTADWSACQMVSLSACGSGVGERNGPVNPEGLVRGFLDAGAPRVLATLWSVDSAASRLFMVAVYRRVRDGMAPAEAAAKAMAALSAEPATAHPYYWAGYQMFGNP